MDNPHTGCHPLGLMPNYTTGGRLTFRHGEDVVVTDGPGITQGQAITAYGPSGIKGDSGVGRSAAIPRTPVHQ